MNFPPPIKKTRQKTFGWWWFCNWFNNMKRSERIFFIFIDLSKCTKKKTKKEKRGLLRFRVEFPKRVIICPGRSKTFQTRVVYKQMSKLQLPQSLWPSEIFSHFSRKYYPHRQGISLKEIIIIILLSIIEHTSRHDFRIWLLNVKFWFLLRYY